MNTRNFGKRFIGYKRFDGLFLKVFEHHFTDIKHVQKRYIDTDINSAKVLFTKFRKSTKLKFAKKLSNINREITLLPIVFEKMCAGDVICSGLGLKESNDVH
jgi:hypothetical protein